MRINISETNHIMHDDSILMDLGLYADVGRWLEDIIYKQTRYQPLDCSVSIDGISYTVLREGETADTAFSTLKKVKNLKNKYRKIPNDNMIINADIFEGELSFILK